MATLTLLSPAFADGGSIPERYGYTRDNLNPPLEIAGVPESAASLALIVDDPDAVEPAGKVWDHWVVWNIDPNRTTIPEDWDASDATQGMNDYGDPEYGGPNPPDREHTYRFKLYALDEKLDIDTGATKDRLEDAMAGTILEETQLEGTFAP
ncbi:Phospholipid-binding protein [Halanaeroarchaeum sp. HSR-CO]|uniref:YbhB/YbcL family Raf kinase inhibitor-like protein n=1 Tax=Halanaeroarchaeum sp. HSR-CO TaxID=2866382 RepID=UPI00217E131E|nr:YbhB/YbcL family Raf kinase inhibitor-like protein [Halanaeroarchaeum sp. HSR-CO]UWG47535.1 Phospholipid-binding protein [Halanaeroarchaeum sp. HSR-CO]